jgi:hypothetical protein
MRLIPNAPETVPKIRNGRNTTKFILLNQYFPDTKPDKKLIDQFPS